MSSTERLRQLLVQHSVKTGHFVLASGKPSNIYVDARLTTMSPEGMVLIGKLGLEEIESAGWQTDAVGGLTLGADPVAYAISHTSAQMAVPLRAFTVRKEPKTHGTTRLIEGPFKAGDRVVIVEDVITTGQSALRAIEAITTAGGHIAGVLAVVNREEGGEEALQAHGYPVRSLTTISDLISLSHDSGGA